MSYARLSGGKAIDYKPPAPGQTLQLFEFVMFTEPVPASPACASRNRPEKRLSSAPSRAASLPMMNP